METSPSMLALGTAVLMDHRDVWVGLARGDHLEPVVDELLRHLTPVQVAFPRFARRDLAVGGTAVAAETSYSCRYRPRTTTGRPASTRPSRTGRTSPSATGSTGVSVLSQPGWSS